mmetsp:Transcript_12449/g.20919  ORF Transcript_12449/g.20919 Transcript_12449/m.20919 type:complete len:467 (-) Transcript_12449:303-1703(-)
MAGLFNDRLLNQFALNKEAHHFHLVSKFLTLSQQDYERLDVAQAQQLRVETALQECLKVTKLPYFLQAVLKRMLRWEALERPSAIKLRRIFEDEDNNLEGNLDNRDYVDDLIQRVMKVDDSSIIDEINNQGGEAQPDEEDSYDDEADLQFTEKPAQGGKDPLLSEKKDVVNDIEFQVDLYHAHKEKQQLASNIKKRTLQMGGLGTKGDASQITVKIRELQNGVTKLISGRPDFLTPDCTLFAKAVAQSDSLLLIDFQNMLKLEREAGQGLSAEKQRQPQSLTEHTQRLARHVVRFLPLKFERAAMHRGRSYLFMSESVTAVAPNGKIFVLGGRCEYKYSKLVYLLQPELKSQVNLYKAKSQPFEEYYHLAHPKNPEEAVQFYETYRVKDMLEGKANFGHFVTNYEVFVAGGSSEDQFSLQSVHSYDIKQDVWLMQPDLNIARRSPSICLFRGKYIYVFGGSQLKPR